jgi:hypothetical protein
MDYSKASYAININDYRVVFRSEEVDANRNFIPVTLAEATRLKGGEVTPQELLRKHGYQAFDAGDVQTPAPEPPPQIPSPPPPVADAPQGDAPVGIENAVLSRDPPPVTGQEKIPEGASVDDGTGKDAPADVDEMSITELRVKCKELGIKYSASSKRVELVALVKAHEAAQGEGG